MPDEQQTKPEGKPAPPQPTKGAAIAAPMAGTGPPIKPVIPPPAAVAGETTQSSAPKTQPQPNKKQAPETGGKPPKKRPPTRQKTDQVTLTEMFLEHAKAASLEYFLVVIEEGQWPYVEACDSLDELVDSIRRRLGTNCQLFPFLGHRLTITKGPNRYLKLPRGIGARPLFEPPTVEDLEEESLGWVGDGPLPLTAADLVKDRDSREAEEEETESDEGDTEFEDEDSVFGP